VQHLDIKLVYKKTARNVYKTTAHNMCNIKYALRLRSKNKSLDSIEGNNRCNFSDPKNQAV